MQIHYGVKMTTEQIDFCLAHNGGYITWNGDTGLRLAEWKSKENGVVWLYCKRDGDIFEAHISDLSGSFWHSFHTRA